MEITAKLIDVKVPREVGSDVVFVEKPVVVTDGIAKVPPSCLDFDELGYIENPDWLMLPYTTENTVLVLDSLDECNPPDLRARWTLHRALRSIQAAADALEKHIASNGLWLSEDEWDECDSDCMRIWEPEDLGKKIRKAR